MIPDRRAAPRFWDRDWYVLSSLMKAIRLCLDDPALRLDQARVLDFGCGTRPYEALLTSRGAIYLGADISGNPDVPIGDDGRLSVADGSCDMVVSFQVLEHVWDVDTYLAEAHRVIKAEGWLLLSTHGTWLYHPHPGDYRRWTREGLSRELTGHGFSEHLMLPVAGPLAWTTVLRLVGLTTFLCKLPVLGKPLAGACAVLLNFKAWLEDALTPASITRDNACVYVAMYRRA
jgi:SAM-dependent methyltransferase